MRLGSDSNVSIHLLNYHLRDGQSQTHSTLVDVIRDREFPKELEEHGEVIRRNANPSIYNLELECLM